MLVVFLLKNKLQGENKMLSDRLKTLRLEAKLTQKEIATKLGISQPAYAVWENGKRNPNQQTLATLSNFFNVSVDYLLGNTVQHGVITFTPEQLRSEAGIDEITYSTYFQTLWKLKYGFTRDDDNHIIFSETEVSMFKAVHEIMETPKEHSSIDVLFAFVWLLLLNISKNKDITISPMPAEILKKFSNI